MRHASVLRLLIFSTSIALISCTKDRPATVRQGQGQNLKSIQTWDGLTSPIITGSVIQGGTFISAEDFAGEESHSQYGFNNLPLVHYRIHDSELGSLVKDAPFWGKPNTKDRYLLHIKIENNKLVFSKLAQKIDLPYQELPTAEPISYKGQTWFASPLLSYDIEGFYNLEALEDPRNQKPTHVLAEFQKKTKADANYFRINLNSRRIFLPASKRDVFPVSYFDGEWFYGSTIVGKRSDDIYTIVGENLNLNFEWTPVARVQFSRFQNELRAIDQNRGADDTTAGSSSSSSGGSSNSPEASIDDIVAMRIPIEHVEFSRNLNDPMTEETLNDSHPRSRPWMNRELIALKLADTSGSMTRTPYRYDSLGGIVEDMQITDDYLGFTVFYRVLEVKIRYSLKRATAVVKPQVAWRDDFGNPNLGTMARFGFFNSQQKFNITDPKYYRERSIENNTFVNRFYPEVHPQKNIIEFRFSTETSELFKPAARRAVAKWDELFQRETPYRVVLNEEEGPALVGDIRYNVINIVDDRSGRYTGLLGFGPSIADPQSGQLISATTNIFARNMRRITIDGLRDYVYSELKLLETKPLYLPSAIHDWREDETQEDTAAQPLISSIVIQKPVVAPVDLPTAAMPLALAQSNGAPTPNASTAHQQSAHSTCGYHMSLHNLVKDAKRLCQGDLVAYIDQLKKQTAGLTSREILERELNFIEDEELRVLNSCADQILAERIEEVILHEMGHNFGLMHNFIGSLDPENFFADPNQWRDQKLSDPDVRLTSSVMEYLSPEAPQQNYLGEYDAAAIRLVYGHKLELVNDKKQPFSPRRYLSINPGLTIEENLARAGNPNVREFKYCGDFEAIYGSQLVPLCYRHDWGRTPLELVSNKILGFNSFIQRHRFRLDRSRLPYTYGNSLATLAQPMYLHPIARLYSFWRFHLGEYLRSVENLDENAANSLYGLSEAELNEMIARMSQHPEFKKYYDEYYAGAHMFAEFLVNMPLSITDRYCVLESSSVAIPDAGKVNYQVYELSLLQDELPTKYISSCHDAEAQKFFASRGLSVVDESGHLLNDIMFIKNKKELEKNYEDRRWDILGLGRLREIVFTMATDSLFTTSEQMDRWQLAIPIHEPRFRKNIQDWVMNRILYGVSAKDLGLQASDSEPTYYFYRFSEDSGRVAEGSSVATKGRSWLYVLGVNYLKSMTTIQETKRFEFFPVRQNDIGVSGAFAIARIDGNYYVAKKYADQAQKIIHRYNWVNYLSQNVNAESLRARYPDAHALRDYLLGMISHPKLKDVVWPETPQHLKQMPVQAVVKWLRDLRYLAGQRISDDLAAAALTGQWLGITEVLTRSPQIYLAVHEQREQNSILPDEVGRQTLEQHFRDLGLNWNDDVNQVLLMDAKTWNEVASHRAEVFDQFLNDPGQYRSHHSALRHILSALTARPQ